MLSVQLTDIFLLSFNPSLKKGGVGSASLFRTLIIILNIYCRSQLKQAREILEENYSLYNFRTELCRSGCLFCKQTFQ